MTASFVDGSTVSNPWLQVENEKECLKCKIMRPPRAHHCSNCNKCTLRLDHHCKWVGNCLGLRNQKAFILFCSYMFVGGSFHIYLSYQYVFGQDIPDYLETSKWKALFYFHNFSMMFATFYSAYMWSTQMIMSVINNIQLIEMLKGVGISRIPLIRDMYVEANIYDMYLPFNFVQVFGYNVLAYPLPLIPKVPYWGLFYPIAPNLPRYDQEILKIKNPR